MRKLFITAILIGSSFFGFSQTSKYLEMEYSFSTKAESVAGLELGIRSENSLIYAGIEGRVFTAKRTNDNTTHIEVGPRVYYSVPTNNGFVDPYVGATYHYGSASAIVSEFGPEIGIKFGLNLKNDGYMYLRPSATFSQHPLYSIGIGFGGIL